MTPLATLRLQIADGRPRDEPEARRMALRATKLIADDADRLRLYEALVEALSLIELRRVIGEDPRLARATVEWIILEIEAALANQIGTCS